MSGFIKPNEKMTAPLQKSNCRIESGRAILEDEAIGVRVVVGGDCCYCETMRPRMESMMVHADRIEGLIAQAREVFDAHSRI